MTIKAKGATIAAVDAAKTIEQAVAIGQETLQTVVKAGTDATLAKAATLTKDQVEVAVKAGHAAVQGVEDVLQFNKDNVDALIAAGTVLAKGWQDLSRVFLGLAQEAIEDGVAASRALSGARTLREMIEIQSGLAKSRLDRMLSESGKLSEVGAKLAEEAFAPINNRLSLTVEKLTKVAA